MHYNDKKDQMEIEKEHDDYNERELADNEIHAAVLAWTAARLLALPVELSLSQVERPFLGPAGAVRQRLPRGASVLPDRSAQAEPLK